MVANTVFRYANIAVPFAEYSHLQGRGLGELGGQGARETRGVGG